MSLTSLGELTLAAAVPGAAAIAATGQASIVLAVPNLEVQINVTPPSVDFAVDLAMLADITVGIQAALSAGLTPPTLDMSAMIQLAANIATLNANLQLCIDFLNLLATGGLYAYVYSGPANELGAALTTELSGGLPGGSGSESINALIFGTRESVTWTAMSNLFKVTP